MKQLVGLLLLILLSSSCTAVFNRRSSTIKLKSNESAEYLIAGDTIKAAANETILVPVENSRNSIDVTIVGQTDQRKFRIASYKPAYYWLNVVNYGVGFIVDEIAQKKFTYPKKIYVDFDNPKDAYRPYFPMEASLLDNKSRLSISPFHLIGGLHPGIEVSYQRVFGERFAAQIGINKFIHQDTNFSRSPKGFRLNLEGKQYFRNQEKNRFYSSINLEYLRKSHDVVFDVNVIDIERSIYDDNFFTQQLTVEKRFVSLVPRIGFEHYITKRLVFDAFFGVGARYIDIKVPDLDPNLEIVDDSWLWFDGSNSLNRPKSGMNFNFDMNFKIGWVF